MVVIMVVVMVMVMFALRVLLYFQENLYNFPLEHHEEAVVQFLDAGCLALPMCFQKCAAPRLERQKT